MYATAALPSVPPRRYNEFGRAGRDGTAARVTLILSSDSVSRLGGDFFGGKSAEAKREKKRDLELVRVRARALAQPALWCARASRASAPAQARCR